MPTRVFYTSWQLECCGDAFSVGDRVSWTAQPASAKFAAFFGSEDTNVVDWFEEHHQEKRDVVSTVQGTVAGIRAVWQRHEMELSGATKFYAPVRGDVVTKDLMSVEGWTRDQVGEVPDAYQFVGYLVDLS